MSRLSIRNLLPKATQFTVIIKKTSPFWLYTLRFYSCLFHAPAGDRLPAARRLQLTYNHSLILACRVHVKHTWTVAAAARIHASSWVGSCGYSMLQCQDLINITNNYLTTSLIGTRVSPLQHYQSTILIWIE